VNSWKRVGLFLLFIVAIALGVWLFRDTVIPWMEGGRLR
jgi:hypothetical protein